MMSSFGCVGLTINHWLSDVLKNLGRQYIAYKLPNTASYRFSRSTARQPMSER